MRSSEKHNHLEINIDFFLALDDQNIEDLTVLLGFWVRPLNFENYVEEYH